MRVLIIGVEDHRIQKHPLGVRDPRREQRRKELKAVLDHAVRTEEIGFIGEETYPEEQTIARAVACRRNVHWASIEMSRQKREDLGIADDQNSRPKPPNETRVASDPVREEYMVKAALEQRGSAQTIMIVCGQMHACALAERFRSCGCEAELIDFAQR